MAARQTTMAQCSEVNDMLLLLVRGPTEVMDTENYTLVRSVNFIGK
jgi:hypothetical protein